MTRPLRIDYPGAIHHVMNRGANHQHIFLDKHDRTIFYSTLANMISLWSIKIHAYSLMDNHYHLLLETPMGNLSRAMRYLDGVYTQRINKKHNRDGSLFRGRFKSILVHKDAYFLELVRYIHLNGVRAGLYSTADKDPHSSHLFYRNPKDAPSWLTRDTALGYFGSDPRGAVNALDAFVKKGIPAELQRTLDGEKHPALLGTNEFIEKIKRDCIQPKPVEPEKSQEKPLRKLASPRKILRVVMMTYRVRAADVLARPSKKRNAARRAAIYFFRRAAHLTYPEIGRWMGGLRPSYLSRVCASIPEPMPFEWRAIQKGIGKT